MFLLSSYSDPCRGHVLFCEADAVWRVANKHDEVVVVVVLIVVVIFSLLSLHILRDRSRIELGNKINK